MRYNSAETERRYAPRSVGLEKALTEALGNAEPWTDEESKAAERLFVVDDFITPSRGWILPDGRFVDMSGGTHHIALFRAFSRERRENLRPFDEAGIYARALAAGLIRFGTSPVGVYVELLRRPTPEQIDALDEVSELRPASDSPHSYVECAGEYVEYLDYRSQKTNMTRDAVRLASRKDGR